MEGDGRLRRKKKEERLAEQIVTELAAIGLTRATDVLYIADGQVGIKTPEQMGKAHAAAIAAVEKSSAGWKIKFYDKLKALELLGDYLGMFGSGGGSPVQENNLLEAILSSTQEAIDTGDLQELQQTADSGHDLVEQAGIGTI